LTLGAAFALDALLRPLLQSSARRAPKKAAAALMACALALGMYRQYGVELYDFSGGAALYAFALQTPKDARFAGPPELMDNVLTFGQRNVYASFELAHPWSVGYWSSIGPRLARLAEAAYAANPADLRRFCQEERIDYFVVDRKQYTPEAIARGVYFEPYATHIRTLAAGTRDFAALSGAFPAVRVDENVSVLDMRAAASIQAGARP